MQKVHLREKEKFACTPECKKCPNANMQILHAGKGRKYISDIEL